MPLDVSILRMRRFFATGSAPAFDPASLFASGEEGVWYEPSTTTAFASTTDLTPCGYGDSCGFLLDKSQGAGYSGGFTGLGSEKVTNGTFDSDVSGWTGFVSATAGATVSNVSSTLRVTKTGSVAGWAYSTLSGLTTGRTYLVSVQCLSDDTSVAITDTANSVAAGDTLVTSGYDTARTENLVFTATATTLYINVGTTAATADFDNISVKELPGNHATQATAASRPILARVPEGGRRNLFAQTEDFVPATSDWVVGSGVTITANAAADPNGEMTADRYQAGVLTHSITQDTGTSDPNHTVSLWVKAVTPGSNNKFRLAAGGENSSEFTATGDWQRFSFSPTTAGVNNFWGLIRTAPVTALDVYIWGAQLETGSSATAYQKVVSEYDVTESGVTSLEYLSFDGVDDWLVSGTNSTWNYMHNGADGAFSMALQTATVPDPNTFYAVLGTGNYGSSGIGFELGVADRTSFSENDAFAPVVRDGSAPYPVNEKTNNTISDIDAACVISLNLGTALLPDYDFRENGVTVYSGSFADTPSTSNATSALVIGTRSDTINSSNWEGHFYGLVIRDSAITGGDLSDLESYLADLSGVTL